MNRVLEKAIEAHGGMDRWRQVQTIEAEASITGASWARKGWPDALRQVNIWAQPDRQLLRYQVFDGPFARSEYTPDRVAILGENFNITKERSNPRAAFSGHSSNTPWDELHLAYFSGYAMWNYLVSPFLFVEDGFILEDMEPWEEGEEVWDRLRVTYPKRVHTHCPTQIFFFDEKGLFRRMEYSAEVTQSGPVRHDVFNHRTFDGIVVPTSRRAQIRNEDGSAGPVLIAIDFNNLSFRN